MDQFEVIPASDLGPGYTGHAVRDTDSRAVWLFRSEDTATKAAETANADPTHMDRYGMHRPIV